MSVLAIYRDQEVQSVCVSWKLIQGWTGPVGHQENTLGALALVSPADPEPIPTRSKGAPPHTSLPPSSLGCLYKDELHELGSEFRTKDCYDCTCSMDGSMRCCQAYGTPVGYDKKKCKAIFNKKTCTYRVVEKKDRSKECEGHAMVG
uniref:Beta-microseminoprotein n=1 Tax=Xenopus tropicalis TaxID=8364 RepID=A0A803KBB8_XENTR